MSLLFLDRDFEFLCNKIEEIRSRLAELSRDLGESCQQGAETFHDNFPFEEATRLTEMWNNELSRLLKIQQEAKIIGVPSDTKRVGIGHYLWLLDLETDSSVYLKIGSYLNAPSGKSTVVPYNSPLGACLLGKSAGTDVSFVHNQQAPKNWLIVKISIEPIKKPIKRR